MPRYSSHWRVYQTTVASGKHRIVALSRRIVDTWDATVALAQDRTKTYVVRQVSAVIRPRRWVLTKALWQGTRHQEAATDLPQGRRDVILAVNTRYMSLFDVIERRRSEIRRCGAIGLLA
jgi:hypothetical protein